MAHISSMPDFPYKWFTKQKRKGNIQDAANLPVKPFVLQISMSVVAGVWPFALDQFSNRSGIKNEKIDSELIGSL